VVFIDGMRPPILKLYDPKLVSWQELLKTKVATKCHMGHSQEVASPRVELAVLEVQDSSIVKNCNREERKGNTKMEKIHILEEVPSLECLDGHQYERIDGTPTAATKEGSRGHYNVDLEKHPNICIHSHREEPTSSDYLAKAP
jgi:hypothetical protein